MLTITRELRLNPWTANDIKHGQCPESTQYDFHEPDRFDNNINKAESLFVRMSPADWDAAGCPVKIMVTVTDITEEET